MIKSTWKERFAPLNDPKDCFRTREIGVISPAQAAIKSQLEQIEVAPGCGFHEKLDANSIVCEFFRFPTKPATFVRQ